MPLTPQQEATRAAVRAGVRDVVIECLECMAEVDEELPDDPEIDRDAVSMLLFLDKLRARAT